VVFSIVLAAAPVMATVCVGDCNTNGVVSIDEILTGVNIALGNTPLSACPSFDSSGNGIVTVDEILAAVNNALSGCGAPLTGNAQAKISVLNRSGSAVTLTLHGSVKIAHPQNANYDSYYNLPSIGVPASCSGSPPSCYSSTCTCRCDDPSGLPTCDVTVGTAPGLAPGEWVDDITVTAPATGQIQYHRDLFVSGTTPNPVSWTVFKTAYVVTSAADSGNGTLRNRINTANATDPSARPVLIRFDHATFPNGFDIDVGGNLNVTANDTVIDGTNPNGDPSPVAEFRSRMFNAIVNLTGTAKFTITAPSVMLIGLQISRSLGPDNGLVGADLDQVRFGTTSYRSRIRTCRLDGGAGARVNANCSSNNPAQGKDCIDAENTGATSFAEAVVVEDSELRHCYDRPTKSQDGFLILSDSWIHNNLRGGPFVQAAEAPTPGGSHLKTVRNLIEHNGKNCPNAMMCGAPNGTPTPCVPQAGCPGGSDVGCGLDPMQTPIPCIPNPNFPKDPVSCGTSATRPQAAQLSAEASATVQRATELQTDGDVLRNGLLDGVFLRQNSYGQMNNEFICGMTNYGMEVNYDAGSSTINVRGTASVFSTYGALLHASGSAVGNINFGTSATPTPASNAFSKASARNFLVESGTFPIRKAQGNQWEHCGNLASCDLSAIQNNDKSGNVDVTLPQAQRNPGTLSITSVYPSKVANVGDVVRITGTGFNAIDGTFFLPPPTQTPVCNSLKSGNSCNPQVNGICVEFRDASDNLIASEPEILGITPTQIVLKSPVACSVAIKIRVTQLDAVDPTGKKSAVADFCKN
jgi:hypothetical protein